MAPTEEPTGRGSTSTGVDTPTPPACDPGFDSGLGLGEVVWTTRLPSRVGGALQTVVVSAAGSVYAVGSLYGDDSAPIDPAHNGWFVHLSAKDGSLQAEFVRDLDADVQFLDVAVAPDGGAIVSGYEDTLGERVAVAYAITPEGTLRWRQELDSGLASPGRVFVDVAADGRIVVGVTGVPPSGPPDGFAFMELTPTGEISQTIPAPAHAPNHHRIYDMAFDPAGVLYAGTVSRFSGGNDEVEWIGRWDVDGSDLGGWERPVLVHETLVELSPGEDGVTVLNAAPLGPDGGTTPVLRALDEAGSERWTAVVVPEENPVFDFDHLFAQELVADCLGRSWILAEQNGISFDDVSWLLAYDMEGTEVVRERIVNDDDPDYRVGYQDIAADPFGNLVLVGIEHEASSSAVLVQLWAR